MVQPLGEESDRAGLDRRELLLAAAALGLLGPSAARAQGLPLGEAKSFSPDNVDRLARALAAKPYVPPTKSLPPEMTNLSYDEYRMLRFDRANLLWKGGRVVAEPMMRGGYFLDRVTLFSVENGRARPIGFDAKQFSYPPDRPMPRDPELGFSGVRFLGPINSPDVFDEIAVFQGASYFRSLGRNQLYGLSARGLAIGSGGPAEQFPLFRSFWLERSRDGGAVILHALLDGPSIAGAYHMTIRTGQATTFDIDARLYPRNEISVAGVAPMSSMFMFGPGSRRRFDDFRPAVHDSDGLEMWTGAGDRLWRPLANPTQVTVSAFADVNPRGFGLMQRARSFRDFSDAEVQYEKRPSLWVEPLEPWGAGTVQLLELPTDNETTDNIVAFWRPEQPWTAGHEVRLRYRLHWTDRSPTPNPPARVVATRTGASFAGSHPDGRRHYAIDFERGDNLRDLTDIRAVAATSAGVLSPVRLQAISGGAGAEAVRASFELAPPASGAAELRLMLERGGQSISENWLTRWTA
ncbi:glucan biosynthesis protein [Sphingomonas oleivorans]|uniref:glucan biosynthesis protein n=1 Tax=Sphingomonas oleivorans TaxID=1735121 RepID=UPI0013FDCAA4|nr:glucan biosynthesis protein [Sphingomonas oleivorans]